MTQPGVTIVGSGHYVPGEPVTNEALSRVMDTNDAWIRRRTGIAQRHFAPDGVGCSDLAVHAAKHALQSADVSAEDVDYIIFATMTPDFIFPGSGGLLGAKLGIPGVPALDIRQQCAAIPFGLQLANSLILTGEAKTIMLVGAEAHAGFMPWTDWTPLYNEHAPVDEQAKAEASKHRGVAVIFGDGAGALILKQADKEGHGLIGSRLLTDGRFAEQIFIQPGGFRRRPYWVTEEEKQSGACVPSMEGRELFKNAVIKLPQVIRELCEQHQVGVDQIDCVVSHQANSRINQAVQEALGIAPEKVPSNIDRYGNTSAATIPILMDELLREGRVKRGDLLCFVALGAGLNWGASLMRL